MRIKHKPPSIIQDLIDTSKIMSLKQENGKSIRDYINPSYKYSLNPRIQDLLHESRKKIRRNRDYKHSLNPQSKKTRRGGKRKLIYEEALSSDPILAPEPESPRTPLESPRNPPKNGRKPPNLAFSQRGRDPLSIHEEGFK